MKKLFIILLAICSFANSSRSQAIINRLNGINGLAAAAVCKAAYGQQNDE